MRAAAAREGLDEQAAGARQAADLAPGAPSQSRMCSGRAAQAAGVGRAAPMTRCESSVEVASLVPMKTAIFGRGATAARVTSTVISRRPS